MESTYDAVVVGAGPNGLAASIRLAQDGRSVLLIEANDTVGGGIRSAELTRPGYIHDVCSAIHPFAAGTPFFRSLDLERFGLEWIHPDIPLAHPLDGGTAAEMHQSLDETVSRLGIDGRSYDRLMRPLCDHWEVLSDEVLQPLLHIPKRPFLLARFGLSALQPATMLAARHFRREQARALLGGLAAHSLLSLEAPASSAIGLMLAAAGHSSGWPMPCGGAQSIADALAAVFLSLGGEIQTGRRIERLDELPRTDVTLLDVTVKQFLRIAGDALPRRYRRRLAGYRFGPAVFKLDYALSDPVPWQADACTRAGTVHLGGSIEEIAESEKAVANGRHPERPFVLVAEHTRFDRSRAPEGGHTLWAYCHVPHGSTVDMTDRIERQIERYAPGFRDCIVAKHAMTSEDMEAKNENLVGGDINGGTASLAQLLARPVLSWDPYSTPLEGVFLCSASTPPGGGVHGMCGFRAAEQAIARAHR